MNATKTQKKILDTLQETGSWSFQGRRGFYTFGSEKTPEFVVRSKTAEGLADVGLIIWTGSEWKLR